MAAGSKEMTKSPGPLRAEEAPVADDLADYCPDLAQWPSSWRFEDRDVAPGQQIVKCFKPFLRHLLGSGLSRKTLRQHRDHLWMLGGRLIEKLHETPSLRKQPMDHVVREALDDEGGPLIRGGASEDQQRAFDATCRKFYRFIEEREENEPRTSKTSGKQGRK
jgi:hypothetical protein